MFKYILFPFLFFSPLGATSLPSSQTKTFDYDWKFARFGSMPDGSTLPEPGSSSSALTASSTEGDNTAKLAMDNDKSTRWCASNANSGNWITTDFGKSVAIKKLSILWEKKAQHLFTVEGSSDNKKWNIIADNKSQEPHDSTQDSVSLDGKYRFIRLTVMGTGGTNWASVRELTFTDDTGKPIVPLVPKTATKLPQAPEFSDKTWRSVNLPHDWGIEGPFRMDLPNETGKLPWAGIGWYRKSFNVAKEEKGQCYYLDFDGVMSRPKVYVNGELAGQWAYGYSSFRVDITPFLKWGDKNTIAVRVDNPANSSRWYPGGGIYRHVWLTKTNPAHIAHWGIAISTPEINKNQATVNISTTLDNTSDTPLELVLEHRLSKDGQTLASEVVTIPAGDSRTAKSSFTLPNPNLWNTETPHLYTLYTTVLDKGVPLDAQENTFGIRHIEWKADGFYLNKKRTQLKGVCQHHDLGPLGGASYAQGYERQIKILKSMGVNAIRASHNPPSPEMLEACDKNGILVINELFDTWSSAKKGNDYSQFFQEWHERDLINLVKRDRNHPSVIIWSAGNEIGDQGEQGRADGKTLVTLFKREDPTRSVTVGCDNPHSWENGWADVFDVYGFNYKPHLYKKFAEKFPERSFMGSETASCVSTRGEYFFPVSWEKNKGFFNFQVSSYDLYAPGWAYRPDVEFAAQEGEPKTAGEFVWTGFDYLGEPTPYNQDSSVASNFHNPEERAKAMEQLKKWGDKAPSRSSYFGIMDLCGFPKDRYYIYQAQWKPELRMAHILPHWNWPERKDEVTPVHVYSSGDSAELFLNGKSQGIRKKGSDEQNGYRFVWNDVVYAPGTLKVVVQKEGKPWATATKSTTGKTTQFSVTPEKTTILGDGRDLAYITITMLDSKGKMVPTDMSPLSFALQGPAEIIGVCNGNPLDHSSFQAPEINAFNGMAQLIIRSKRGESGPVKILVKSPQLKSIITTITVTPATPHQISTNR